MPWLGQRLLPHRAVSHLPVTATSEFLLANIRWNFRRADSADTADAALVCGQARLIPWTPVNLIAMSLLALALPDVERTAVATLDSFEDVAEIFERNLPNQVRSHSAPALAREPISPLSLPVGLWVSVCGWLFILIKSI